MSRPMSSSGVYGTTFGEGALSESSSVAGRTCTSPPMDATTRIPKIRSPVLRSIALCSERKLKARAPGFASPRAALGERGRCDDDRGHARERAAQVLGHQHGAGEEQQSADEAQEVVRRHRAHHVDEAVTDLAEIVEAQPQQRLR